MCELSRRSPRCWPKSYDITGLKLQTLCPCATRSFWNLLASLLAFQLWLPSCFSLCSLQFREGFRGLLCVNFVSPLFWLPLFQDFPYNSSCSGNSEFWPLALQPYKNETLFLRYSSSAGHQIGKALRRKVVSVCTFLISRVISQFLPVFVCCWYL